jgi:hypothetical protein
MVRRGPVSLQFLASTYGPNLNAECMVWKNGMASWKLLREVPEVLLQAPHHISTNVQFTGDEAPRYPPALSRDISAASATRVLVSMPGSFQSQREPRCQISVQKHFVQENLSPNLKGLKHQSKYHDAFNVLMREKASSANIFGDSWRSMLGFFAPFGTENSFLERLKKSPSFKHLFVYDGHVSESCADATLSAELSTAKLDVAHVDTTVNNASLVCALVLSIPTLIVGVMGSNKQGWSELMHGLQDHVNGGLCLPSANVSNLYSVFCLAQFDAIYKRLFVCVMLCFYSSIATLFMSVFYFMCRPSEMCNCFSKIALMEAFKIEIREERMRGSRRFQPLSGVQSLPLPPSEGNAHAQALSQHFEDLEIFWNAKWFAENKMQELKNHEFYMWYKSELLSLQDSDKG